jgi:hypothetical protein
MLSVLQQSCHLTSVYCLHKRVSHAVTHNYVRGLSGKEKVTLDDAFPRHIVDTLLMMMTGAAVGFGNKELLEHRSRLPM